MKLLVFVTILALALSSDLETDVPRELSAYTDCIRDMGVVKIYAQVCSWDADEGFNLRILFDKDL